MPIGITWNGTGMQNSGNEGTLLCITLHYFSTTTTSYMVWMTQTTHDKIVMALISQIKFLPALPKLAVLQGKSWFSAQ
jgi:hypothetical protein